MSLVVDLLEEVRTGLVINRILIRIMDLCIGLLIIPVIDLLVAPLMDLHT